MLNIYYGSENIEREKFIFEHIKGRTLLLVPDQFSLQAERDAFFYLGKRGLMDVSVVDFSSLGGKVIRETDGEIPHMIDKYGRHMLLSRILRSNGDKLGIYRGLKDKSSFAEMVNGFISEMKRADIVPEMLEGVMNSLEDSSILKHKLDDLLMIYKEYEEDIKDKYTDSEDYIAFYGKRILSSETVAASDVWIYGFDTFTPKNFLVMERLLKTARNLNIVMTYSDNEYRDKAYMLADESGEMFSLTGYIIEKLVTMAEELNEDVRKVPVDAADGYLRKNVWQKSENSIILAETSDIYAEADKAAAYILSLVRDEGYRFSDIVVICNDTSVRSGILRRTFIRWGIPVFVDKKRKILHHPVVGFILALMETASLGYRGGAVMELVKSGLMGFEEDKAENLENYIRQFRIRGDGWKKPFSRGGESYTSEELEELNDMRTVITELVDNVKDSMGRYNTAGEKIKGLYAFLSESFRMPERINEMISLQSRQGLDEGAAETAQSWNSVCDIFDQVTEIAGEDRLSNKELLELLEAGFSEIEIGLVPVTSDTVIIGTMQRTRLSRVKSVLIVGANEGIFPLENSEEGLLNERERNVLENFDIEMVKSDEVMRKEERLAVYRILSLPSEKLYMSFSRTDENGEESAPSEIFRRLSETVTTEGNLGEKDTMEMITSADGTLSYIADAFRQCMDEGKINGIWLETAKWYKMHRTDSFEKIIRGMTFDNSVERLGEKFADALYRRDRYSMEVSASRLEKYSSCPFAHFISYGLRPDEARIFEMGARETGDVYHECIMKLSQKYTEGKPFSWATVTEEQCRKDVAEIIENEAGSYREGLLKYSKNEKYRTERIADICSEAAWSLVKQVRKGSIKDMYFERSFGTGESLPPVRIDVGGRNVVIKGKIDRIDVLDAGSDGGAAVRIVDYKTGSDSVDVEYFRKGYKLQLMVYMKAASGGEEKPAGVFLFKIHEPDADADVKSVKTGTEESLKRIENSYRMEGIVVNDPDVIEAMDGELEESSSVIPVKKLKKTGEYAPSAGGYLFTGEEFAELSRQVEIQLERICREICSGNIDIKPKRENKKDMDGRYRNACKYCGYKSICMFDTAFRGCRFEQV